jgi:hypothetical protein
LRVLALGLRSTARGGRGGAGVLSVAPELDEPCFMRGVDCSVGVASVVDEAVESVLSLGTGSLAATAAAAAAARR